MAEKDQYDNTADPVGASFETPRTGALNVAVIFGVAAIALTLILAPFVDRESAQMAGAVAPGAYDDIVTGSISTNSGPKRYIVRRSVLQDTPGAVCIINSDGSTSGC